MTKHTDTDFELRIAQIFNDLQLDDAPAGGALVVYQAGECIMQASVGMAQKDIPWQADTLSLNFSTGKGVLSTLIHVLVSQGLLDYDAAIASYWSDFAANGKADITLRQVLSHQANLFAISSIETDSETLIDWQAMLAKVAAMPMTKPDANSKTGDEYESAYSALIFGWVLGGLIEAVTDMTLAQALRHYLTEPLGIADSCYFGVPEAKVNTVAKLVKDFEPSEQDSLQPSSQTGAKRHKPVLKVDSPKTLEMYQSLPSYHCWQQRALDKQVESSNAQTELNTAQINRLYFDHSAINANNYRAALVPSNRQPINYHTDEVLKAVIPAANGVASAKALATIYAMLANGGVWQGKTIIDKQTFTQLAAAQSNSMDAVMPAAMNWRLGYHRLFSVCNETDIGFGHMGYNGSVAWCDPAQQLSFAFVHNFDTTMLNDIRQFALTEAVLSLINKN
ncbi:MULTISPECIES: serine hydrolase domain-containing protein [unclassified Psychrobacter]|uniref:serine hydrolase domain-containing protein n=1 Tax=unclassified Psychrobacter TaxID=196806 RepID=UPI003FD3B9FD